MNPSTLEQDRNLKLLEVAQSLENALATPEHFKNWLKPFVQDDHKHRPSRSNLYEAAIFVINFIDSFVFDSGSGTTRLLVRENTSLIGDKRTTIDIAVWSDEYQQKYHFVKELNAEKSCWSIYDADAYNWKHNPREGDGLKLTAPGTKNEWILPLMEKLDTDERDSNSPSLYGVVRPSRIIAALDNLEKSPTA